jgi:hypothetical protein
LRQQVFPHVRRLSAGDAHCDHGEQHHPLHWRASDRIGVHICQMWRSQCARSRCFGRVLRSRDATGCYRRQRRPGRARTSLTGDVGAALNAPGLS